MIDESVQECRIRIGKKYLREIIQLADFAFRENFLHARINRKEHMFEVWVTPNADKKQIQKFKEEFGHCCRVRYFEEKK